MNNLRTCPNLNLELIDLENRSKNCECSKNVDFFLSITFEYGIFE